MKKPKISDAAMRMFKRFHGKSPMEIKEMVLNVPKGFPKVLVLLGDAHTTDYVSNKKNGGGDGKKNLFTHRHKKGTLLCTDAKGKALYTVGPELKVTRAGIEN